MADAWDPSAFGLTPTAPAEQAPAPAPAPAWDAAEFGLTPVQGAAAPAVAAPTDGAQQRGRGWGAQRPPAYNPPLTEAEAASFTAGTNRAVSDIIDRPAEWMAGLAGQGEQVRASDAAARQAYETQYAADPIASTGRAAGQIGLTVPLAGAVGGLAGAGADLAAAGAGRVSPLLGRAVQGVGDFLSGDAGGPGFVPRIVQGASTAAGGALQGGTVAALTAGQSDAPVGEQALQGAVLGGVAAPLIRGAAGAAGGARNAVLGGDVNPEVASIARTARDKYGINLTADMISSSPFVRTMGSTLEQVPMSGMAPAKDEARRQFTRAVAGTLGEEAEHVTPAVMERAVKRIGGVMDDVATKTGVPVDAATADGLENVARASMGAMPASERPLLQRWVTDILDMAKNNGGTIPGEGYQTLTNYRSDLATALRTGTPTVKEFAGRVKSVLDDALERAAVASGDTSAIDALRTARLQYKNVKTIEPLVTKGEPGEISPTRLLGVVDKSFRGRGLRTNQPDLGELADIGQRFNLGPDSGTPRRAAAYAAIGALGSAGQQLVSGQPMNALMTAGAIPATMLGGRLATAYLRSPTYINSLMARASAPPIAPTNSLLDGIVPLAVIGQGRLMGR